MLDSRYSREEVSDWALQWVFADDPGVEDMAVWHALDNLGLVDLKHGPDGDYLYNEHSFQDWLEEFLRECSLNP